MIALEKVRDTLLTLLALIGAVAIVMLMIHVSSDVILRNTINFPIPATYEIATNYYMVTLAFIPLAWVEKRGGMVQVEVIETFLSPKMLKVSDALVALLSTVVYVALAWFTLKIALNNFNAGTFVMAQSLSVPTWPAHFLPPLGFALAGMVTLFRIFETPKGTVE
jgi:TRAP-type C4-dicarboxylate transport system permease small subunit